MKRFTRRAIPVTATTRWRAVIPALGLACIATTILHARLVSAGPCAACLSAAPDQQTHPPGCWSTADGGWYDFNRQEMVYTKCDGSPYGASDHWWCYDANDPHLESCNSCGGQTSSGQDCSGYTPPDCSPTSDAPGCGCDPTDPSCCRRLLTQPVDARTGVLLVGPTEDVRLVGAFGDDLVFRRSYASARQQAVEATQVWDDVGRSLALAPGWVHNFQARLIDLSTRAARAYVFVRDDGRGYRFGPDLADQTGEGWTLTPATVTDCAGSTSPSGWKVRNPEGTEYDIDPAGRVVRRRALAAGAITSCYAADGKLDHVQNDSGQSIWFNYDAVSGALATITRGAAAGPRLAAYEYTGGSLTRVCYGADCLGENYSYVYCGGRDGSLLTEVWHGGSLVERHRYAADAAGCHLCGVPLYKTCAAVAVLVWHNGVPVGVEQLTQCYPTRPDVSVCLEPKGDRVAHSWTSTEELTFDYDTPWGTVVNDRRAPAGDPYASATLQWDGARRLTASSSPTGCSSDYRAFAWGTSGPPTATARAVGTDANGGAILAWTARTYETGGLKRLLTEVENAPGYGPAPPPGVTRTTTYAYADGSNPLLPTTITRTPSVLWSAGAVVTTLSYDDQGNVTQRREQGLTRDEQGQLVPFDHVTYTEYVTFGNGNRRPLRSAGSIAYVANQARPWHTVYDYYAPSDGARLAYRLKTVTRYPLCPQGATCAGQFVAARYLDYDDFGRPTATINQGGETTVTTYDHFGRVTSSTRGSETTTSWYDAAGRIQATRLPAGNGVHYHYAADASGFDRLLAVTRVPSVADPPDNSLPPGTERTTYVYDGQGNVTGETRGHLAPDGTLVPDRVTSRTFFQRRVQHVLTASGALAVALAYDPNTGALVSRTEYPNGAPGTTWSYGYAWGRLASAPGTAYGYDVAGNLTAVTDEASRTSSFEYDDAGRLVASTTPSGGTMRFWYTPRGDLAGRRDAVGRQIAPQYDALGRVLTELHDSGAAVSYGYDAAGATGLLSFVVDTAGTTSFGYDARGRVTSETRRNGTRTARTVGYSYDANGNLAALVYPDGTQVAYVGSSQDPDRAASVSAGTTALATGVTWDGAGGLASLTYGNAAVLTRQTTLDGAPQSIAVSDPQRGGQYLARLDYARVDRFGRPLSIARRGPGQPNSSEAYGYDEFGRLTTATVTPPLDGARYDEVSYRYAGPGGAAPTLGNRTQEQQKLGGAVQRTVAYGVGAGSSLVSEAGALVGQVGVDDRLLLTRTDEGGATTTWCSQYDVGGSLRYTGAGMTGLDTSTACASPARAYCTEYDDWGRLALAGQAQPDGTCAPNWTYEHDWKGRRVAVRGQGAFAAKRYDFFYDASDRLLTEIAVASDGAETPEHNYYWLSGEPLAQDRLGAGGGVLFFHNDHLGTPQRMSQADGTVKWAARYSPFGELGAGDVNPAVDCQPPAVDNPLRFPGQYDDQRKGTGFSYYNYHRYYDPAIGRYTQPDPLVGRQDQGPYQYAGNNPVDRIDPLGLRWIWKGVEDEGCHYEGREDKSCEREGCNMVRKVKVCRSWVCSGWMWEQEGLDQLWWDNVCYGAKWWGLGGPNPTKAGSWDERVVTKELGCVSRDENLNPTRIWKPKAVALGR